MLTHAQWFKVAACAVMMLSQTGSVFSKADGAPAAACGDLLPNHNAYPQMTEPPYTLETHGVTTYEANVPITMTITGTEPYIGLLMKVSKTDGSPEAYGQFSEIPPQVTKFVECDNVNDGVTHSSNMEKINLTFTWMPLEDDIGTLTFLATVLKDKTTFWTTSSVALDPPEMTTADENATTTLSTTTIGESTTTTMSITTTVVESTTTMPTVTVPSVSTVNIPSTTLTATPGSGSTTTKEATATDPKTTPIPIETRSTTLAVSATASSTEEQFNTTDSGNDETTTEFMWGKEDSATTHSSCVMVMLLLSMVGWLV